MLSVCAHHCDRQFGVVYVSLHRVDGRPVHRVTPGCARLQVRMVLVAVCASRVTVFSCVLLPRRWQLIEKWRTDFVQMMAHHAVTILLVSASYFQHFHISGTAVLITLDVADIFLPLAKVWTLLCRRSLARSCLSPFLHTARHELCLCLCWSRC
jgi:hypothetical protein